MTGSRELAAPDANLGAGHDAAERPGPVAAERLRATSRSRLIETMLTTTLSRVPAISRFTSITPSIASAAWSLWMIPSSTRRSMRLSHSMRAAWPWGSGASFIDYYNATSPHVSPTQFSSWLHRADFLGRAG